MLDNEFSGSLRVISPEIDGVGEIAAPYPISLNAVSKHLKVLERAGLVRRARRGRDHFLTLNARPLHEVARWALQYERYWSEKLDLFEAHFAKRSRRR